MTRPWNHLEQTVNIVRPANGLVSTRTIFLSDAFKRTELRNLRCEVDGATIDGPVELFVNGVKVMRLDEMQLLFDANDKPLLAYLLRNLQIRIPIRFAPHGFFFNAPMSATVTISARGSNAPDRATSGAVEQPLQTAVYDDGGIRFR
jgi:hypothetical protein